MSRFRQALAVGWLILLVLALKFWSAPSFGSMLWGLGATFTAIGAPVFWAYSSVAYYRRPGQEWVNDDADDPRKRVFQAPKDGPSWLLWQWFVWVGARWPLFAFPTIMVGIYGWANFGVLPFDVLVLTLAGVWCFLVWCCSRLPIVRRYMAILTADSDGEWLDLSEAVGMRKPDEPEIEGDITRNDEGRIVSVAVDRDPMASNEKLEQRAAGMASSLKAVTYDIDFSVAGRVEQTFFYEPLPDLLTIEKPDLPTDVPASVKFDNRELLVLEELYKPGWLLGKLSTNGLARVDYRTMPHVGLWGGTGSGKGLMVTGWLLHAVLSGYKTIVASPKTGEYQWAASAVDLLQVTRNNMETLTQKLEWALAENDRREKLIAKAGLRNWTQLCESTDEDLGNRDRIVVFIDELTKVLDAASLAEEDYSDYLIGLIRQLLAAGRSSNINVVLITQQTLAEGMGGSSMARAGLNARVYMGVDTDGNAARALRVSPKDPKLLAVGTHGTAQFAATGLNATSEGAKIVAGRCPHISTGLAAVVVAERCPSLEAQKFVDRLVDAGSLPDWLLSRAEAVRQQLFVDIEEDDDEGEMYKYGGLPD